MNLRKITRSAVVAGATTALAAGVLVGLTSTTATAATGTANYNCTNGFTTDVLPLTLSATADLTAFPPFATGFQVPEDIVGVEIGIDLSPEVVAGLKAQGINSVGATSTGMSFPFGSSAAALKGFNVPSAPLPATGGYSMKTTTANEQFALPEPGTLDLLMPTSFSLTNVIPIPLDCTVAGTQGVVTTYTVVPQNAAVTGKAPKAVKKGQAFSVVASVVGDNKPATGKVSLKAGSKKVGTGTLKNGKATIKLAKGIKKTTTFTVVYAGDTSTNGASSAPFKVTVKK